MPYYGLPLPNNLTPQAIVAQIKAGTYDATQGHWKAFPKIYQDAKDPAMIALAQKMDFWIATALIEILAYAGFRSAARCPASCLTEFGYMLGAGILNTDSEATKRAKITGAITAQKAASTWTYDIQPKIFAVTGIQPILFSLTLNYPAAINLGDANTPALLAAGTWWSLEGGDNTNPGAGDDEVGDGTEIEVLGNTRVDLGSSTLTAAKIAQIVLSIGPEVPAFVRMILGYTISGQFVAYAGGQIH